MSPSELLRKFADMLDAKYDGVAPDMSDPEASNVDYKPESGESESCGCEGDSGLSQQPDDVFVPPLQLKLELLKKATGVDSIYDDGDEPEDEEQHCYNELAAIRRNAGINPVVLDALGDDEPLDV